LLLENVHPFVHDYLKNLGYLIESEPKALDQATLIERLQGIDLLGIRSKTDVSAEVINQAPDLKAIGAFCIGTNQIALSTCSQNGIAVFNAPFSNTRSVVELAMAEIILLLRQGASALHQLSRGVWNKSSQGAHEVRGKILGIVGYGHIGAQLSILAEAMGMQVIFYDKEIKLALGNAKSCNSLEALLTLADVVSIHVDGRKENHHFIGKKEFDQMKNGVIFLNLSRDFVVDYEALVHGLQKGKIVGAGVDVFPNEPNESKSEYKTALQEFDNVILTPHIGGSTEEAQQNIGEYVSKNLHAYFSNGTSLGSVNFPQLFLPAMNHPHRIIHIHKNVPGILAEINSLFAKYESNIEGQFLKTNEDIGYAITEVNKTLDDSLFAQLEAIPHTIKVRILNIS
jgi:D-3-phosphoglycerate dehydrogenase